MTSRGAQNLLILVTPKPILKRHEFVNYIDDLDLYLYIFIFNKKNMLSLNCNIIKP